MSRYIRNYEPDQIVGSLKIVKYMYKAKERSYWKCLCYCGTEFNVSEHLLPTTQSCGCHLSLLGKKIGALKVIKELGSNKHGQIEWSCVCSCGNNCKFTTSVLNAKRQTTCGECGLKAKAQKYADVAISNIGKRFGKLTVVEFLGSRIDTDGRKINFVKCRCDCGNEIETRIGPLNKGQISGCGFQPCQPTGKIINIEDYKISSAKAAYRPYKDGDISFNKFLELSQLNCHYCGSGSSNNFNKFKPKNRYAEKGEIHGWFLYNGFNRIDSNKGHMLSNIVPCCASCNIMKMDMKYNDFLNHICKIVKHLNINSEDGYVS